LRSASRLQPGHWLQTRNLPTHRLKHQSAGHIARGRANT
jgi:hypothetical protein